MFSMRTQYIHGILASHLDTCNGTVCLSHVSWYLSFAENVWQKKHILCSISIQAFRYRCSFANLVAPWYGGADEAVSKDFKPNKFSSTECTTQQLKYWQQQQNQRKSYWKNENATVNGLNAIHCRGINKLLQTSFNWESELLAALHS